MNLCHYSDAYIPVEGTITITGEGADDAAKQLHEIKKGIGNHWSYKSFTNW